VYTAAASQASGGEWGIIGVASRSSRIVDALHEQDLLYSVATISSDGASVSIPGVHTAAYVAAVEPARVVTDLADDGIRIVTLTVTENGYSYASATQQLDLADPVVQADLRGGAPRSTIGQLARGLQRRATSGGAKISVLSCDNLSSNGTHTERLVLDFLPELPGAEGAEGLAFIDSAVTFPSSMVDRIVPSTAPPLRDQVASILGVRDAIPVPAEPFTMWAIEDRFAGGRPAWELGGAVFTDEVGKYEQLKVRLLNGTHSLIAYLGALRGVATIAEAVELGNIEAAARAVIRDEYEPSIDPPTGVDVRDYERQLFARWGNTALGHRTSQVGSDGSVKLRQRLPEPALHALAQGEMPHFIALTIAAYLSCIAPLRGFEPGEQAEAMTDAMRERLEREAEQARTGRELAERTIVELRLLGDELAGQRPFIDRVGDLIDTIVRHGVDAAIADCLSVSRTPSPHVAGVRP
jgi:fructuronate reductase